MNCFRRWTTGGSYWWTQGITEEVEGVNNRRNADAIRGGGGGEGVHGSGTEQTH